MLGSIPFAYILHKVITGGDIRTEGSGNVGARNSFETTGKKWVGVAVLILDFLKAWSAIQIVISMYGEDQMLLAIAGIFVVLGHNFNIWLGLKGGRGLASSAGVMIALMPFLVANWLILYFLSYYILNKNVNVASAAASVLLPVLTWGMPINAFEAFSLINITDITQFKIMISLVSIVILLKHIKPVKEAYKIVD